ncbi:ribonuclease D [Alteromonas oceanisediminis]|uniref:ribonuclease D n=1 Tax=Alteromonas oceanisediminis TaxID=2836180 RepID=UPI001BDA7DE7|nr:ribonuclease D [Alteromonas oceanisediminis]MBT0587460.1 ribonuclease D [Alteromonas oceanisediminis]
MFDTHYRLITEQTDFEHLCAHLGTLSFFTLDTEFVRTRTLLPQLGLLQVFDGDRAYLIDPLGLTNLDAFARLLTNSDIVKVLHACSEDLEVFLAHLGVLPAPIFDTQYAANLLGMGPTLGYARLVELTCNVALDKGESRTDWLARPLSENQLHYAANDVIYLHDVYLQLSKQVDASGLRGLIYDELDALGQKKMANMPPAMAYLLIGNAWKLNERQRYVLKKLAAWRLNLARERNSAINFIIKESHLFALAQYLPSGKSQLSSQCGLLPQEVRKHGDTVVGLINQSLAKYDTEPHNCRVPPIQRLTELPQYKKTLSQLKALCGHIAERESLTTEVIASKKQLNQLLKWWWFDVEETSAQHLLPDLLMGWRKPLMAEPLLSLLGEPVRSID